MRIKCEVRRTGNFSEALAAANVRIGAKVEHGLRASALLLFDESQKLVPTDLQALKDSGGIRQEGHGFETVMIVGYGRPGFARMGPSTKEKVYNRKTRTYTSTPKVVLHVPANYAVIVHERLDVHHDNGQAKFLETPLYEKRAEMIEAFVVAARLCVSTQAEIMRSVLIDLGLVVMPGTTPRQSGDLDNVVCFVGQLPDGYSRVLSIYDTTGLVGGRQMNGGRRNTMPGVKLLFRDLDGTVGYRRGTDFAQAVAKALDETISMTSTVVPEDDAPHTIQAVTRTTVVTHLGEELGKKRNHWSLNARLSFPASEPTHG